MHVVATESAELLLAMGGILLAGLALDTLGRRTRLPRISLLLIFGIVIGDQMLGILPSSVIYQFPLVSDMALLVVGFLLGGQFQWKELISNSKGMFWVSAMAAVVTTVLVTLGLIFTGWPLPVIFLLGCIAAATAPAPIIDAVLETKNQSPFAKLLLRVVAVDDVWAMLLFSVGIAFVGFLINGTELNGHLVGAAWEVFGAVLLGVLLGIPASYVTGRIKPGQPTLFEALGLVFLCGGLAILIDVSFLLAVMVLGAMIVNFAKHHDYPFHEIENVEWPFMMVFFILAGASLDLAALYGLGIAGVLYVIFRTMGKVVGACLGGIISGMRPKTRWWLGWAMLPHAGVPIGMALIASNQFPEYRQYFLTVVIGATIFFELLGPFLTRVALAKNRHEP